MNIVFPRFAAHAIVDLAKGWRAGQATTAGRRDKKPHIAARSGGCSDYDFWSSAHIAKNACNVRVSYFVNDFSENRTSQRERP